MITTGEAEAEAGGIMLRPEVSGDGEEMAVLAEAEEVLEIIWDLPLALAEVLQLTQVELV
jgi:hypothetical protein